jgi:phage tail-like protein
MTQATFRAPQIASPQPKINMSVISMQLPEWSDMYESQQLYKAENVTALDRPSLILYPGEPAELLVEVKNEDEDGLVWELQVQGNFPQHGDFLSPTNWCNYSKPLLETSNSPESVEANQPDRVLEPTQSIQQVIRFQLPADFFEAAFATSQIIQPFKLDYQVQIRLLAKMQWSDTSLELMKQQEIELYARPRSSYQNFLPAIYRAHDFTKRFLSIFEQAFDPVVQTIDTLWAYLNPLTAPEALLPFLAQWVACPIDPRWSLEQQRRLIHDAIPLYRWRGTRKGLQAYLHLYTGLDNNQIEIRDDTQHGLVLGQSSPKLVLGQSSTGLNTVLGPNTVLGGGRPYHFIVQLRLKHGQHLDRNLIEEIIDREKPAFSTYDLTIHKPTEAAD